MSSYLGLVEEAKVLNLKMKHARGKAIDIPELTPSAISQMKRSNGIIMQPMG